MRRWRDWAVLLACNFIWASQFVMVKLVAGQLGPLVATAFPMLVATALLAAAVRLSGGPVARLSGRDVRDFVLLGLFGQVVAQLGVTWGTQRSLASNAAIVSLALPVATAVMAHALLRERMTRIRWAGFGLAIAGVMAASFSDLRSLDLTSGSFLVGNLLIFAGVLGSAFYNVFSKRLLERRPPLQVLLGSYCAACVCLAPLAVALEPESVSARWSATTWVGVGVLALFQYGLSMVLFLRVLTRLDATQAALSNYLIPVFGVLLAWAFGERLSPAMVLGAVLVLASTLLVTVYEGATPR